MISCFAGGVAFFSGADFGVAAGSRWGVDTGVGLGGATSCGAAFISGVGFGVVRFLGPPCGVGVGVASPFFSWLGVPAGGGVAETCGVICPGGRLPVGFVVGLATGWFSGIVGWPGVADGFATFRFGGVPFGAFGNPPRTFPVGNFFSSDTPGGGFPPGPVGEPPGVPEGFPPSRFGGTDLLAAPAAFGEAPGTTFAFGEPTPGFTKLGGSFCPIPAGGEPVTCPLLPNCRFTKGVGFGRSFARGFCAAMVFLSSSASCALTPCHPFWT